MVWLSWPSLILKTSCTKEIYSHLAQSSPAIHFWTSSTSFTYQVRHTGTGIFEEFIKYVFFTSWGLEEEEAEADLEKLVYILQLPRAGLISTHSPTAAKSRTNFNTVFQWLWLRALAPGCNWALQLYQQSAGLRFDTDFKLNRKDKASLKRECLFISPSYHRISSPMQAWVKTSHGTKLNVLRPEKSDLLLRVITFECQNAALYLKAG